MVTEKQNEIWFDALLKVAASEALNYEINLLPSKNALDEKYKPSVELDRRIKKIISRDRTRIRMQKYAGLLRKLAIGIIIFIVTSFVTLLSVEATRNVIFNAFIEQYGKYTKIKFEGSSGKDKKGDIYFPVYLPENFTEASRETYGDTTMVTYSDNMGKEILFKQRAAASGTSLIDNENRDYKEIAINGNTAYLFEASAKNDYNVLLWQSEGFVFELTSQISRDELLQIASSISR